MTFADYDASGRQSIWLSYWNRGAGRRPGLPTRIQGAWPGHNRSIAPRQLPLPGRHRRLGIGEYHADSFTAVFADFNGDGKADIYQANDHRVDRFYRNLATGNSSTTP